MIQISKILQYLFSDGSIHSFIIKYVNKDKSGVILIPLFIYILLFY